MHALVLSGGGARGAFHLGVLDRLADTGVDYDYIFGVSAGALVGSLMAESPRGMLRVGVDKALRIWDEKVRCNRDIYKRWPFGKYLSAPWKTGLWNAAPLQKLVRENLNYDGIIDSGRTFKVGVVSYGLGEYRDVSAAESNKREFWKWVYASAAVPPEFEPIWIPDDLWGDGGARTIAPFSSAIKSGADTIDVVVTRDPRAIGKRDPEDDWFGTKINLINYGLRIVGMAISEIFVRDVYLDMKMVEHINARIALGDPEMQGKRHITVRLFQPEKALYGSLEFGHELNQKRIDHGRVIADKVIKAG